MPIKPQDHNNKGKQRQPERKTQKSTHYGENAKINPDAEETQPEEYKELDSGLQKTTKYSVDKH